MAFDPTMTPDLWAAFPRGYLDVPGTVTVGGHQVLRGRDGVPVWFWPQEVKFSRPGLDLFDDCKDKLVLLPDITDTATWAVAIRVLAERCHIDPQRGALWVPKGKEVIDRQRGSSGKAIAGWSLRTVTKQVLFPIAVSDEKVALLRALAMTNCACGRGPMMQCPIHGDSRHRPWR